MKSGTWCLDLEPGKDLFWIKWYDTHSLECILDDLVGKCELVGLMEENQEVCFVDMKDPEFCLLVEWGVENSEK